MQQNYRQGRIQRDCKEEGESGSLPKSRGYPSRIKGVSSANYLDSPLRPFSGKLKKRKPTAQGKVVPVTKSKNPYVKPTPGGGSGATVPVARAGNQAGVDAQTRAQANRPAVSTDVEVNYESDPVLAKIKALGQQSVGNAQTEAAKLRKQAIIDTGLADVGAEIGLDAGTLQAARENPLSVAARIQRESALRNAQLDESLNQQNLFYSGYRGTQLGNLGRDVMEEQANLSRDLRAALGGIDQGVLDAQSEATAREQEAISNAAAAAQAAAQQQAFMEALLSVTAPETAGGGAPFDPMDELVDPSRLGAAPRAPLNPVMPTIPYLDPREELLMQALGLGRY